MKSAYFSKLMYFWYSKPDSGCKEDAIFGWSLPVNPALQVRNAFISSPVWCPVSNKFPTSRRICFLRDEILSESETYFWKQFTRWVHHHLDCPINKKSHIQQQANAFQQLSYMRLYIMKERREACFLIISYISYCYILFFF